MRVKAKLIWSLSQERPCIMVMQDSLHTLQFWVTKHISALPPTWRVKASWAVRRLLGSSCSVISWLYFPLVSHKQWFPFGYFFTRVHLLQIAIYTSKEKSLSCVRRTGFQQRVERCVRGCALPSPAEDVGNNYCGVCFFFKPKQTSLQWKLLSSVLKAV